MRIFVYEYTCAALSKADLAPSLRDEGSAMLDAVLEDFAHLPGVEANTLREAENERAEFCRLAAQADYTLVIAPEFDEILQIRCRWVAEAGGRSLNATSEAIRLTADKWALANHLRKRGVPTPPATRGDSPTDDKAFPAVLKPRFGAGSQATYLVKDARQLEECAAATAAEGFAGELIVQPFVPGQAASVAFLCGPAGRLPLWPAAQHLSADGRFWYLGGTVPLPGVQAARAVALADRALAAVPGLCGYVGVDVVLREAADGGGDTVIEINPRLTTSYIGLRQVSDINLAAMLLRWAAGEGIMPGAPLLLPRAMRTVRFYPDGRWESL